MKKVGGECGSAGARGWLRHALRRNGGSPSLSRTSSDDRGYSGDDRLVGTRGSEVIVGGVGDEIYGLQGRDVRRARLRNRAR